MGRRDALIWALAVSIVGGVGIGLAASSSASRASREQAIRQAQVWLPATVSSQNLKSGPGGPLAFKPGETVTCDFVPKPHGKGSTLKFDCKLPSGRNLKVRYGAGNGEVYAQVAATRLLWALGFPPTACIPSASSAAAAPPIRSGSSARHPHCPGRVRSGDDRREGRRQDHRDEAGRGLVVARARGRGRVARRRAAGAARRAQAARRVHPTLVNKAINQRIVCLDAPRCSQTVMMMPTSAKPRPRQCLEQRRHRCDEFSEWAPLPIWKDSKIGCVANLPASWERDAARSADQRRRARVSRRTAQSAQRYATARPVRLARVTTRDPHTSIDDWVAAFKRKRAEIANRRCD